MFQRYSWFRTIVFTAVLILTAVPAHADPQAGQATRAAQPGKKATSPAPKRACANQLPWYCGVSAKDRESALVIYAQANQLFDEAFFPAAVVKYQEALAHWDHPGIHYNLMLALVAIDQPIEAYQRSIAALRYGDQALKPEEYRRALDYQKLLHGQIASLEVTCDEPGALVSMNGKEILRGPGTVRTSVLPGQYELVATKEGYLTTHHVLVAVPEKPLKVDMRLLPQKLALLPTRRWSAWKPWAVVGAGVGLGLAGGYLEWQADRANRSFQDAFDKQCRSPDGTPEDTGCFPGEYTDEMATWQRRSTWYRRVGHGASVAGGVAMLSGLALVYLNREQSIENPERQKLTRISLLPSITPDAGGLAVHVSF